VLTPDDIMSGVAAVGPVVVYDDDHYYMGGVVAEKLRGEGLDVTLVTPANEISTWTNNTEEQHRVQSQVLRLGVVLETGMSLARIGERSALLESIHTGQTHAVEAATIVMVTSRVPQDGLFYSLADRADVQRIGDCLAPGPIARAVYSGHRVAREMDAELPAEVAFLRET
jgi:dimethylamine/trimethylamine dehydrogenase